MNTIKQRLDDIDRKMGSYVIGKNVYYENRELKAEKQGILFALKEVNKMIDSDVEWFNLPHNYSLNGKKLVCCQTTLKMLKDKLLEECLE